MAEESPLAWKVIPEFASTDINKTITFYTTILNFKIGGTHVPDDSKIPTFCSLFKGEKAAANIYFRLCEPKDFRASRAWVAMSSEALETFHQELQEKKESGDLGEWAEKIDDMPWGYRQFGVYDSDGNVITFFRFLDEHDDEGNEEDKTGEGNKT